MTTVLNDNWGLEKLETRMSFSGEPLMRPGSQLMTHHRLRTSWNISKSINWIVNFITFKSESLRGLTKQIKPFQICLPIKLITQFPTQEGTYFQVGMGTITDIFGANFFLRFDVRFVSYHTAGIYVALKRKIITLL